MNSKPVSEQNMKLFWQGVQSLVQKRSSQSLYMQHDLHNASQHLQRLEDKPKFAATSN